MSLHRSPGKVRGVKPSLIGVHAGHWSRWCGLRRNCSNTCTYRVACAADNVSLVAAGVVGSDLGGLSRRRCGTGSPSVASWHKTLMTVTTTSRSGARNCALATGAELIVCQDHVNRSQLGFLLRLVWRCLQWCWDWWWKPGVASESCAPRAFSSSWLAGVDSRIDQANMGEPVLDCDCRFRHWRQSFQRRGAMPTAPEPDQAEAARQPKE